MPKSSSVPKTSSSSGNHIYKRESPSSDDVKPSVPSSSIKKQSSSPNSNRRPWTNNEFLQLFEHVVKHGASGKKVWETAVEGRTANQSYLAWLHTLSPFLKAAIETRKGR
ncbi:uncharacterized protein I206_100582 [Kwoniella pini CBS 10737]|uniref:Myb-like domain-containing protein n=1 Tax=Kwoniella pini CBS 10737 TaxID=1296096 RepID=A0A1B9IDU9_9TREE|nr:uncharacterized protein I206_00743 [Kwoniella pini CBS 10737]OCF53440.1 hypothetical protein I206_00743 [Kwoniella pini CBS 10737]